jgi:hypothetical protein
MHRRVPQERGKSCRFPWIVGKGKADSETPGPPTRVSAGRERNMRHTAGIAKRRKRSAAKRMAGWLSVLVIPMKRGNSNPRGPRGGKEKPKGGA